MTAPPLGTSDRRAEGWTGRLTRPLAARLPVRLAERLSAPAAVGARRFPPLWLVVLAAIGGSLLLILASTEWQHLNDEYAYWLAGARLASGAPLYDPTALPNTPYAYWYPPPLAQVMAPLTSFLSADAFAVAWTALLLVCLWW